MAFMFTSLKSRWRPTLNPLSTAVDVFVFCAGRLRSPPFYVLAVWMIFTQTAHGQPTVGAIVELVLAREKAIASLETSIERKSRPGRDLVKANEAVEDYNVELARMYKYNYERRPVSSEIGSITIASWSTQWTSTGQQRIEFRSPRMNGGDSERVVFTEVERVMCFDGTRWQTIFKDDSRPVMLESTVGVPPTLEVLGVGGNVAQFANNVQARTGRTLGQALKEAIDPQVAIDPAGLVTITFLISAAKDYPKALRPVSLEVQVSLDPKLGFAPVKGLGSFVMPSSDGLKRVPLPGMPEFDARWSEFVEVASNCWLAKALLVNHYETVALPKTAEGFQPLVIDGKPVMFNETVQIDPESISMARFHSSENQYTVTSLTANGLSGPPECSTTLAEGTVVQDRDIGAVYQMTGTGASVDNAMRRMLHPQYEPKPVQTSLSVVERIALVANVAVVVLLLTLLGWRVAKRRTSPS